MEWLNNPYQLRYWKDFPALVQSHLYYVCCFQPDCFRVIIFQPLVGLVINEIE